MARVSFTKLGLIKEQGTTTIKHNDQEIEVKKYLPVNEKLKLISDVINNTYDEKNNFANPLKVTIFTTIGVVEKYTNVTFTEKQKEDPAKLYDLLTSSDFYTEVYMAIPKAEMTMLVNGVWDSIEAFYKYKNSALGIMEIISQDYSNLNFDAENIQKNLSDPENLEFVRSVLNKLG